MSEIISKLSSGQNFQKSPSSFAMSMTLSSQYSFISKTQLLIDVEHCLFRSYYFFGDKLLHLKTQRFEEITYVISFSVHMIT